VRSANNAGRLGVVINAVGPSGRIVFYESVVYAARPGGRLSLSRSSREHAERRHEEKEPVWQRRNRRVPRRVRLRVRRVRYALLVGQRPTDRRGAARPTWPVAALLQVAAQPPGVRRAQAFLRRLQMGLRSVHRGLLRHPRLFIAP